jgi:hypothetical protein
MPEAHRDVDLRPELLFDLFGELTRDAQERRAADRLVATPDLVQKLGRARPAAADVREKRGEIVEIFDRAVTEQKKLARRHGQNEKVAFRWRNMTCDLYVPSSSGTFETPPSSLCLWGPAVTGK